MESSYPNALPLYQQGLLSAPELVAHFLVEGVKRLAGSRWRQAARPNPLPCGASAAVRVFATHRLYQVPDLAARSLCAWSKGLRSVELMFQIPTPREILAWQAKGRRCVSLLEEQNVPAPHGGSVAFVVHDLCHLEKFYDPAQHTAQVGFFSLLDRAMQRPEWSALDQSLDDAWRRDLVRVMSDMNGSPIFLWAALKAGLRPALHRREHPNTPFDAKEESPLYRDTLAALCDWFTFPPEVRRDAFLVSDRQSSREASLRLFAFFEAAGNR